MSFIASVDQGTASSRCLIFDSGARVVSVNQKEHHQIFPRPGWVEHDPEEIWPNVVGGRARRAATSAQLQPSDLAALGITNQRETTVRVGPRHRQAGAQRDQLAGHAHRPAGPRARRRRRPGPLPRPLRAAAGHLLLRPEDRAGCSTPCPACASAPRPARCCSGRSTSWLIWKLTGRHVTDVTNASRTMLMNLETLDWDDVLLDAIGVPRAMLPEIRSSSRGLRRGARAARRRAGRLRARRPAGGAVRPDLLLARRGQVHLRHRQLPAAQHRRASRCVRPTGC